jgi:hypothetical protein
MDIITAYIFLVILVFILGFASAALLYHNDDYEDCIYMSTSEKFLPFRLERDSKNSTCLQKAYKLILTFYRKHVMLRLK